MRTPFQPVQRKFNSLTFSQEAYDNRVTVTKENVKGRKKSATMCVQYVKACPAFHMEYMYVIRFPDVRLPGEYLLQVRQVQITISLIMNR